MNNFSWIIVLGVLTVGSLSMWPLVEPVNKVASQGKKIEMNEVMEKMDLNKMFSQKAHFMVAKEWFEHKEISMRK